MWRTSTRCCAGWAAGSCRRTPPAISWSSPAPRWRSASSSPMSPHSLKSWRSSEAACSVCRAPTPGCTPSSNEERLMTEIEVTPEHASDPNTRRVGILVGVVGVLLSVVTIASHRAHTQAVIHRTESNDQWAYYQAKKTRENSSDVALELLQSLAPDAAKAAPMAQKLETARDKYADDAKEIMKDAQAKDTESEIEEQRALRFDIGEGLLELGLVLCSLYFLARKSFFPILGTVSAVAWL